MPNLVGLHDKEGAAIAPPDTWLIDTVALSESPQPTNYVGSLHWIARLNWGYGSTGTIPTPDQYGLFAQRVADYVRASRGCHRWIVGNEPNLPREWPDGQPIYPWQYAQCFKLCRDAIRALPGHEADQVLIAAPGPWNADLKGYAGNERGDWVTYLALVINTLGPDGYDGVALHSYTHGYDVALVTSEKRMDAPFHDRRYEFRAYQDFMAVIPRGKRVYLTEANGNGRWRAVGLMQAMAREIASWNETHLDQPILCVAFYRYPTYDEGAEFAIEGKDDVIAEYRATVALGLQSPTVGTVTPAPQPQGQENKFMPSILNGTGAPTTVQRKVDQRLIDSMGVQIVDVLATDPNADVWRLIEARWFDKQEAGGRHHLYVETVDEHGNPVADVPFEVRHGGKVVPRKTNGRSGFDAANFDMYPARNGYDLHMPDGDRVLGAGMGAPTPDGGFNAGEHTAMWFKYQRQKARTAQPQPTQPQQPVTTVPTLVHPVADPRWRTVTQVFGVNGAYYSRLKVDGVPLRGHNGIDFGTPVGTSIVAVDDGVVVEVANDESGYGEYVKMRHPWGESLYAHLLHQYVQVGEIVPRGTIIGASGNTGKSTGPHLHFGMRVNPFNRADGWGGYSDPAQYLINVQTPPIDAGPDPTLPGQPAADVLLAIKAAAQEFGVDWRLLASQAWAESSFNPQAKSPAGAKGLLQIMDATWTEWAPRVNGGNDPLDARQNARVAAVYLTWLIGVTQGSLYDALAAYGWGIGNWLDDPNNIPDAWANYASKIIHGRDLLKAVEG